MDAPPAHPWSSQVKFLLCSDDGTGFVCDGGASNSTGARRLLAKPKSCKNSEEPPCVSNGTVGGRPTKRHLPR